MQQVSGRVVPSRVLAFDWVDVGVDRLAHGYLARSDLPEVGDDARHDLLGVADVYLAVGADELAGVADLAAGLGVEGGLDENDLDVISHRDLVDGSAVRDQAYDDRRGVQLLVAEEPGRAHSQGFVHANLGLVGGEPGGRPAPLPLRRHLPLEPFEIDLDSLLAGDLLGHLDREAIRVPQAEHHLARQGLGALHGVG